MIESLVSGKLHGKPVQRMSKAGKPYTTARLRVSAGGEGESQFVGVTAFSDTVQATLMALGDGDGVAVAGSLTVKTWVNRDGVTVPDIGIIAAQVLTAYHLKRKRQAVQGEGDTGNTTAPPPKRTRQQLDADNDFAAYGDLSDV
jgi:single-stranded DNA-binding protein